jgi:hypothetical protein
LFIMQCLFIVLVGRSFMRLCEVLPTPAHH